MPVHGVGSSSRLWKRVVPALSEELPNKANTVATAEPRRSFQSRCNKLLRLIDDPLQVLFPAEALRVEFVNVLGT